jgi:nitrite reductase/ring-hydroxylating ferredoxin subunit
MAKVHKVTDVQPGQIISTEVDGVLVALANVNGTFHAVADDCSHGGCALSQGDLWETIINCPCHGGQFDLITGDVVGGPPLEPVRVFPVKVSGDEVIIG